MNPRILERSQRPSDGNRITGHTTSLARYKAFCIPRRADTVSNHNDRFAFGHGQKFSKNLRFRKGIQITCRFVHNDEVPISVIGTGDGKLLSLTTAALGSSIQWRIRWLPLRQDWKWNRLRFREETHEADSSFLSLHNRPQALSIWQRKSRTNSKPLFLLQSRLT